MSSQENNKLNSLITKNRKLVKKISSEIQTQTEEEYVQQDCKQKEKKIIANDDIIRNETQTKTTEEIDKLLFCVENDEKSSSIEPSNNVLDELDVVNPLLVDDQSSSSSSTNNSETTTILSRKNSKTNYFNINMILYYGRECLCILIFIFTTYATYQNM